MFNQEMPESYVPRKYMVRGVITSGPVGTYYEMIRAGSDDVVEWNKDFITLQHICDVYNNDRLHQYRKF